MMKNFTSLVVCLLVLATTRLSAQSPIFTDAYATGVSFLDFGGSTNAVSVDNTVFQSGTSSLKIAVPAAGYTGGAFVAATAQNLTTFNAVSFWIKGSAAKTLNVAGLGNNASAAVYQAEVAAIPVTTTWTKIIIPIPDASKLTAETGLFHLAEGSDEGAYTIWVDNIQYENITGGVIGTPTASFKTETLTKSVGDAFFASELLCTFPVNSVATKVTPSKAYFAYTSSNTAVATMAATGNGTAVGAGTATITAKLGTVAATGVLTVNVSVASAPTVAAPTPTRSAANVISLFSKPYTNVAAIDWFPNWGQSTVVSDVLIAGDSTKKYSNFNYQGVQLASDLNVSTMNFLHIDLWTPNMTSFKVSLINTTGSTVEQAVTLTPTLSGWNSFDIPLSSFNTIALTKIGQLKLESVPSGTTVYLDNIYFYKDAVVATDPTVAAPTPTRSAANVISLFSKPYTNVAAIDWFPNWGQSTVVSDVLIAGDSTKKYTNFNYQGVQLASDLNVSTMNFLHIDLWTPNMTSFKVSLINTTGSTVEQAVTLTPTLSGWNSFDIPLSSFNTIALTKIGQLKLESVPSGTGTAYLDNIYFYKDVVAPTAPTVAAPTPTRAAANVISLFSKPYTNVAGIDWFPNWGQSTVVADVAIAGDTTKKYTNFNYQGVQLASDLNVSTMKFLHIDLWTPNMTSFKVSLINTTGSTVEQAVTLTPTLSGWNSFDIPLSSFNTIALTKIGQLKLESVPSGTGTAYLDNIYFYNDVVVIPAPTVAAPTPTRPASSVISLFSKPYTNTAGIDWTPNWGQSTVVTDVAIAGDTTKRYTNFNYQGVQLASDLNVSTMNFLHIDLWTPNMTSFKVFLINTTPSTVEQAVTLTPTLSGWNSFDIPLSSFNTIAMAKIGQLKLESVPFGTGTAYLDNIYFFKTGVGTKDVTFSTDLFTATPSVSDDFVAVNLTDKVQGATEITLSNLLGQNVYSQTLKADGNAQSHTIFTKNLPAGMYIVGVRVGALVQTQKIAVSH